MITLLAVPLVKMNRSTAVSYYLETLTPAFVLSDADFNLAMSVSQQTSSAVENAKHRQDDEARAAYTRRRR